MSITIHQLNISEVPAAVDLVWRVFSEFEAPDYSAEGIREFKDYLSSDDNFRKIEEGELLLLGAFDGGKIVGVVALSAIPRIHLLFVDKEYHRQGIGRSLVAETKAHPWVGKSTKPLTVNSSPYAVDIYAKLGFVPTDTEQTVNGLRFTPMELKGELNT